MEYIPGEVSTEVTFTATIAPKNTPTKAVNASGVTSWIEGEQISVYYKKTGDDDAYGQAIATVGAPNPDGSASITATLSDAKNGGTVKFVYPASLANDKGDDIDEEELLTKQSGILTYGGSGKDYSISKNFDAATGSGTLVTDGTTCGTAAPITLTNRVCICKFSLFTPDGQTYHQITQLEKVIVTVGDKTYDVELKGFGTGNPNIYIAMLPVTDATALIGAYNGGEAAPGGPVIYTQAYASELEHVTLTAGKFYQNVPVQLVDRNSYITSIVTNTIPDGETIILNNASIVVSSGPAIQCAGDATIILMASSSVVTLDGNEAAIFIPEGKTLTIRGPGSLTAKSTTSGGAGIGGGVCKNCGNINICSGTVEAYGGFFAAGIGCGNLANCGNITICGGTVTAIGGGCGAGIGSGQTGRFASISITDGITSVTAIKGTSAEAPIGRGYEDTGSGTVTIDGTTEWAKETTHLSLDLSELMWILTHK